MNDLKYAFPTIIRADSRVAIFTHPSPSRLGRKDCRELTRSLARRSLGEGGSGRVKTDRAKKNGFGWQASLRHYDSDPKTAVS